VVTEVLFGNCLMAGQGQAPARQAAFKGGLPQSAGAVTLSKMCGSGMRAAMFGARYVGGWFSTRCWSPAAWKA
jgi:acetyl-CoA C-acetyltransferase